MKILLFLSDSPDGDANCSLSSSDCTSIEACGTKSRVLGVSTDPCSWVRDRDGFAVVYTSSIPGLVPVCVGVSNSYALQPSVQQRSTNLTYSWGPKERSFFS